MAKDIAPETSESPSTLVTRVPEYPFMSGTQVPVYLVPGKNVRRQINLPGCLRRTILFGLHRTIREKHDILHHGKPVEK